MTGEMLVLLGIGAVIGVAACAVALVVWVSRIEWWI